VNVARRSRHVAVEARSGLRSARRRDGRDVGVETGEVSEATEQALRRRRWGLASRASLPVHGPDAETADLRVRGAGVGREPGWAQVPRSAGQQVLGQAARRRAGHGRSGPGARRRWSWTSVQGRSWKATGHRAVQVSGGTTAQVTTRARGNVLQSGQRASARFERGERVWRHEGSAATSGRQRPPRGGTAPREGKALKGKTPRAPPV